MINIRWPWQTNALLAGREVGLHQFQFCGWGFINNYLASLIFVGGATVMAGSWSSADYARISLERC